MSSSFTASNRQARTLRDTGSSGDLSRSSAFWTASKPAHVVEPARFADPPLWWHAALALAAALTLQSAFGPALAFRGGVPPLVMLVVGWYGLRAGALRGLLFGLIAGACEDAFAGTTGAAWTFATAAAGLGAGRFARTWAADMPPALCLAAAVMTVARYAAFVALMLLERHAIAVPLAGLHAALWQGVEAALLAAVLLRVRPELVRSTPSARGAHAHRR
ncbi:MAG: hypothetical protein M3R53_07880 [Candidatus Eremiobacteraeota bacterium]|nr:hypothetical protein [Candidatus Eremiobacteraeota bacterium]